MEILFRHEQRRTQLHFHTERQSLALALKQLACDRGAYIFLDSGLGKIWRHKIIGFGIPPKQIVSLKAGEKAKEWRVIGASIEFLSKRAHERSAPIVVIGGGGVCDAGALVASLYRRGVPLVLVPTTLLAMVDASIGGKTAIDLASGDNLYKNIAGTFYPATDVHFWPNWLDTLPPRERLSGVGELLKTLWLAGKDADPQLLRTWIEGKSKAATIWPLVESAVTFKAQVVSIDPLDKKGDRAALNYGHTFGHAFESLGRGKIAHGEAIAWGMWAESSFLENSRDFPRTLRERIQELGFSPPKFLREMQPSQMISFLRADKKMRGGKIEMSILRDFGRIEKKSAHPHELAKFAADIAQELR